MKIICRQLGQKTINKVIDKYPADTNPPEGRTVTLTVPSRTALYIGLDILFIYIFIQRQKRLFMNDFEKYISIDPAIRFGKPCIKNTRIAVVDILNWLSSGMSFEEIMKDYPEINMEQIKAALAFVAHRKSITKIIAARYEATPRSSGSAISK